MRRIVRLLLVVIVAGVFGSGCGRDPASPRGGIVQGSVLFLEGNFQPVQPTGTSTPVRREMRIYALASESSDVDRATSIGFYRRVRTRLVASVISDADGHFEAALPPGTYSLFSVEGSLLYASTLDVYGHIDPIEVRQGELTSVTFRIIYRAVF